MTGELDALVTAVTKSRKYRHIAPDLIRRIGAVELQKRPRLKEAIKATKNKLHQVGGAYFDKPIDYERALATIAAAADGAALRAACREVMALHTSTRERLPILDDFYALVREAVGPVASVLDVACGLNPLALPWLQLPPTATVTAVDVYGDMLAFLDGCWGPLGVANGRTVWQDVVAMPSSGLLAQPVDLAFILKTLPVLAQVDETAVPWLLDTIQARHLVISFPAVSLGGRGKGMVENYTAQFMGWVGERPWQVQRVMFDSELLFLVKNEQADATNHTPAA